MLHRVHLSSASSRICLARRSKVVRGIHVSRTVIRSYGTKGFQPSIVTIGQSHPDYTLAAMPSFLSIKRKSTGGEPSLSTDFHYQWLRHNCNCSPGCLHPKTKERIVNVTDILPSIQPKSVSVKKAADGEELSIAWEDGHSTQYPMKWLNERAYSSTQGLVSPADTKNASVDDLTVQWKDRSPAKFLSKLQMHGALVVRGGLATADDTLKIVHSCFSKNLVETHFGLIEDLRTDNTTNKNNDQLGYTDAPVDLHTDQPFIANPPSMQLLHCIRNADSGGESIVSDALAAARFLKNTDESAYHYLTRVPIVFHRKQKEFESMQKQPIIRVDENDVPVQVRFSYFTLAPLSLPFNQVEPWYRAYRMFTDLVYSPKFKYQFLLRSGDFVLYDNHRMLHARTGFKGARWMRGIYVERPDVYATLSNPATKL